jgi:hypothetical protein
MSLHLEPYSCQSERLPQSGRHILAQFDEQAIVVYQAFTPVIGHWAVEHGHFGSDLSFTRMSWIKTSFLWMMYRSGWATKTGQEVVLAAWLQRTTFEAILAEAVPSAFDPAHYPDQQAWSAAVARSTVRLQWDPDRTPGGQRLSRQAIQLGLRGQTLAPYATEWILAIEDITDFVHEQAACLKSAGRRQDLLVPRVEVYWPASDETAARIGLSRTEQECPTEKSVQSPPH